MPQRPGTRPGLLLIGSTGLAQIVDNSCAPGAQPDLIANLPCQTLTFQTALPICGTLG